jgi:hypothetical protein
MTKPYCGTKSEPKGSHLGSAKECMEAQQVRLYGLRKISTDDFKKSSQKKKINYEKLHRESRSNMMFLLGSKARYERELAAARTPEDKKSAKAKLEDTKKKLNVAIDKTEELKKMVVKKSSRKNSRISSKKSSKKSSKRSSKKSSKRSSKKSSKKSSK